MHEPEEVIMDQRLESQRRLHFISTRMILMKAVGCDSIHTQPSLITTKACEALKPTHYLELLTAFDILGHFFKYIHAIVGYKPTKNSACLSSFCPYLETSACCNLIVKPTVSG